MNIRRPLRNMSLTHVSVAVMFLGSFVLLGFGIYGLSGSLMASICLPLSGLGFLFWSKS